MKILFDTNVILDVFLERDPFFKNSAQLMGLAEQSKIEGWISGITVTTIHYLISKELSQKKAIKHIKNLLSIFHVCNVNRVVLEDALTIDFKDYKDAVMYQSAEHSGVNGIVTRNKKDFKKSALPVYNPKELLNAIAKLA